MFQLIRNLSTLLRPETWAVVLCGIGAVMLCVCLCTCSQVIGVLGK